MTRLVLIVLLLAGCAEKIKTAHVLCSIDGKPVGLVEFEDKSVRIVPVQAEDTPCEEERKQINDPIEETP